MNRFEGIHRRIPSFLVFLDPLVDQRPRILAPPSSLVDFLARRHQSVELSVESRQLRLVRLWPKISAVDFIIDEPSSRSWSARSIVNNNDSLGLYRQAACYVVAARRGRNGPGYDGRPGW